MGNSSSRTLALSESHSTSSNKKVSSKKRNNRKPREQNNRNTAGSSENADVHNNEAMIINNNNNNAIIRSNHIQLPPIQQCCSPVSFEAAAAAASSGHCLQQHQLAFFSANGRNGYAYDGVYQLHNLLGRGGFGRVYRATYIHSNHHHHSNNRTQRSPQEQFAIKVTKPVEVLQEMPLYTYDDITTKVGEIKALLRLHKGPGILQMYEFFFDFGQQRNSVVEYPLAIVTELLTGCDLATWLKDRAEQAAMAAARNNNTTTPTTTITERVASIIIQSLLDVVLFMHQKLVVHRDLKITNLRITNPNDPRSIKVYDFGLARVLDHEGDRNLVEICGSLGYTAPEILLSHPYGVEVDMFSVGVILFIVLSGSRPFAAGAVGNRHDVKRRIVQCEYNLDSQRWNRVSEIAKNLVRGLLVERRHRLTAQQAVQHEWFNDDPQSIAILEQSNLNDNAVLIPVSRDEEPLLSHHTGTSSLSQTSIHMVPAVQQAIATVEAVYSSAIPWQHHHHQHHQDENHAISPPLLPASVPLLQQQQLQQQQQQYVVSSNNLSPGAMSLPEYIARHLTSYTEEDCRFLCRKILTAVATLHERNLAHRAIRMEHIYIQRETGTGEIQVSLTGMEYARVSHEGQTLTGTVGTPLVATAPEVYTHLSYNGQAIDVWALGVLIYMLLCGMYPFRGTERELKRNVRNGTIVFDAVVPSENAQDLVHCLIQVHPDARLCVADALLHPWFQQQDDTSSSNNNDLKHRDLGLTQAMLADWIRRPMSSSSSPRPSSTTYSF